MKGSQKNDLLKGYKLPQFHRLRIYTIYSSTLLSKGLESGVAGEPRWTLASLYHHVDLGVTGAAGLGREFFLVLGAVIGGACLSYFS